MAEQTLNGVPVSGLQQWLKENPNDSRAPQLRARLRGIGVDAPDPTVSAPEGAMGYGLAFQQGAILDPAEKLGGIVERLPGVGSAARRAGSAIWNAPVVGPWLQRSQAAGQAHPIVRAIGNAAPWLAVPGGEGIAGDVAVGALAGALQPQDPKDPNYWRTLLYQGGVGGVLGGTAGQIGRNIAGSAAAQRAYQAAQAQAQRFFDQTDERATLQMYQRAYREIGEPQNAPTALSPQTARKVRDYIGGKLNSIYARMDFDPMQPGWAQLAGSTYRTMRDTLANPDMQARWDRAFANDALAPVISNLHALPMSGEKLNQVVTDLGARAREFGENAAAGGVHADQWRLMAEGMRRLRAAITQQIDRANPQLGTERRAVSRAYHIADTVHDATSAASPAASPKKLIDTWERKVGKVPYAGPRFASAKDMLQREHVTQQAGPVQLQPPPVKPPSRAGRGIAHAAVDAAAIEAAHRLGLPFPWGIGFAAGTALTEGGRRLAQTEAARSAAAALGRHPGVAGSIGGQLPPVALPQVDLALPPVTITARAPPGQPPSTGSVTP